LIIQDNFIDSFQSLSVHAKSTKFRQEINTVDGAIYPAISFDIPDHVKEEFKSNIEKEKGFEITISLMFLRANPKGASEPYQAHNDLNMGDYTCILYLTEVGGTSFLSHKETGFNVNSDKHEKEWLRDCNIFNEWNVDDFCTAKENRALIFDAKKMHRGEPVEGSGSGSSARMIMVCFFKRCVNDS
tara:strand:+ start:41 stop:598 length:558 start_codon:yes stop_codon:yes gene_type:complete